MIKRGQRTSPVFSSANDTVSNRSDSIASDIERSLAAHFDRQAVQPRSENIYDQISSIINGTKSKYSSVDEAVMDMQERSGFSAHQKMSNNYFQQKKEAQAQNSVKDEQSAKGPQIFEIKPNIKDTFDNYITDTRGNVSVPAVFDRVRNIHKNEVDDSLWNDDVLTEYVSNKCDEAKKSNPNTDEVQSQNLGKMTNFNDSDIDISNSDALHALSPVKASLEPASLLSVLAAFDKDEAPKDVKISSLTWLDKEDRKQLKDWGTAEEVEGNPPKWVADPAKWKRAKKVVKKYWKNYEEPYAITAHVYENMGGKVKKKKAT